MEYVGWKDVKSAMRYLDASSAALQTRFEEGLAALAPAALSLPQPISMQAPIALTRVPQGTEVSAQVAILRVTISLARFSPQSRGLTRGRRLIEQTCLERYAMQRLNAEGTQRERSIS